MDKWLIKGKSRPQPQNVPKQVVDECQPLPGPSKSSELLHVKSVDPACTYIPKPGCSKDDDIELGLDMCEEVEVETLHRPNTLDESDPDMDVSLNTNEQDHLYHKKQKITSKTQEKKSSTKKASPNKRKLIQHQKFNTNWLEDVRFYKWLMKSLKRKDGHDMAHCKICDIDINAHKTEILRHSLSKRHEKLSKEIKTNMNIQDVTDNNYLLNKTKRAELKLAGFIAANNLPFTVMDTMAPLLKNLFPDSKIAEKLHSKREKTSTTLKNVLGPTFLEIIYEKLRQPGCFFSIIMDETTDQSSIKQCALTVVYIDNTTGTVKTNFFDMYEVKSSTAEDLYTGMKNCLESKNIPLQNFVGFSSDTTNVMVGQYNSVFSHIKRNHPQVACIKCSCHMVHLAASKACLKLPQEVEELLRNLGSHFSRSFCRQSSLQDFQTFFQTEIHKILNPSTTRWLSMKQCVDRVIEQYEPLKAYLTLSSFEEPGHNKEQMLNCLQNPFTYLYLEFMSYVLGILTDFNVLFQSERPLLHCLQAEVDKMLLNLCSNYMNIQYLKSVPIKSVEHNNPRHFLKLEEIYIGMAASQSFSDLGKNKNVSKNDKELFLINCMNFYIEAVTQIKKKFDFSDPVFECLEILEPKTAQSFKIKSLNKIINRFPCLKNVVDIQKVDAEWKTHALLNFEEKGLCSTYPAETYWKKVFDLKTTTGDPVFPNISKVVNLLLVLPFSNASVERVFSSLKRCKTNDRNKLKTNTVVSLMATREGISNSGGCVRFEPTKDMLRKSIWSKKK